MGPGIHGHSQPGPSDEATASAVLEYSLYITGHYLVLFICLSDNSFVYCALTDEHFKCWSSYVRWSYPTFTFHIW